MKDKDNKVITDPTSEEEKLLSDLRDAKPSYVLVRGNKWKCSWLYHGTERKLSAVINDDTTDEDMVVCKCAALMKLNGLWKIKFFYPILWRWFYYFMQYREDELLPFIVECKKKVIVDQYLLATMSLIGMRDTIMSKTRKEVNRFQAELLSGQLGAYQKNSQTSSQPSTISED